MSCPPHRDKPMVRDPGPTRPGDDATIDWGFGELCSHIRAQVLFNVNVWKSRHYSTEGYI